MNFTQNQATEVTKYGAYGRMAPPEWGSTVSDFSNYRRLIIGRRLANNGWANRPSADCTGILESINNQFEQMYPTHVVFRAR